MMFKNFAKFSRVSLIFLTFFLLDLIYATDFSSKAQLNDSEAIRQSRLEQNEAMALGDVDKVAQYWTEDITLRRGLGSAISGKDAYRQIIETSPTKDSLIYVRLPDIIEISNQWPLAFESGTWIGRKGTTDGPKIISGLYSAQWIKRNDTWLIRSEVFVALTCEIEDCTLQAIP